MRVFRFLATSLLIFGTISSWKAVGADEKPNIIFLMADDLGRGDLGCYNRDSKVPTPHMNRLAEQGVRFTDAHTPSSVCTPTRYGVLTGRYSWRTRLKRGVLVGESRSLIEEGRLTVPALLKRHGYQTGGIGKWHLGFQTFDPSAEERAQTVDYARPLRPGPLTVGFDEFFGIPSSLDFPPYLFVEGDHPVEAATNTIAASAMRRNGGKGFWRAGPIAPSFRHIDVLPRLSERAVAFLEKHAEGAKSGQPFFLYLALSAPHTPWLPTKEYRGRSQAGPYGDFVVQVDETLGRVMETLDRLKLSERTLLIFTSDNGAHWTREDKAKYGHLANGRVRGQKADIWEGGHRVPFVARWPGRIASGTTCDQLACHTDLLATCASIVGDELPDDAGEDSFDLLPALLGKPETNTGTGIRPAVVHHSGNGMFAIREGDWKLVEGLGSGGFTAPAAVKPTPGGPTGQLYNLRADPLEQRNLYQQRPEVVNRLTQLLGRYRTEGRSRPARAQAPGQPTSRAHAQGNRSKS
jgi:arylsulfatase A